ncbi:histidine phosphatase family protein [Undibacterium arcticum]
MRHGDVAYFWYRWPACGRSGFGCPERERAGSSGCGWPLFFSSLGVARFDRVISSSLPRTIETAERVTAAYGQPVQPDAWEALREMRSGHPDAISTDRLSVGLLAMTHTSVALEERFFGRRVGSRVAKTGSCRH